MPVVIDMRLAGIQQVGQAIFLEGIGEHHVVHLALAPVALQAGRGRFQADLIGHLEATENMLEHIDVEPFDHAIDWVHIAHRDLGNPADDQIPGLGYSEPKAQRQTAQRDADSHG